MGHADWSGAGWKLIWPFLPSVGGRRAPPTGDNRRASTVCWIFYGLADPDWRPRATATLASNSPYSLTPPRSSSGRARCAPKLCAGFVKRSRRAPAQSAAGSYKRFIPVRCNLHYHLRLRFDKIISNLNPTMLYESEFIL